MKSIFFLALIAIFSHVLLSCEPETVKEEGNQIESVDSLVKLENCCGGEETDIK